MKLVYFQQLSQKNEKTLSVEEIVNCRNGIRFALGMYLLMAVFPLLYGVPGIGMPMRVGLSRLATNKKLLEFYTQGLTKRWRTELKAPNLQYETWTKQKYEDVSDKSGVSRSTRSLLARGLASSTTLAVDLSPERIKKLEPTLAMVPELNRIVVAYSFSMNVYDGKSNKFLDSERVYVLVSYIEFDHWSLWGQETERSRQESADALAASYRKVGAPVEHLSLPDLEKEFARVVVPAMVWVSLPLWVLFIGRSLFFVGFWVHAGISVIRASGGNITVETWDSRILPFWFFVTAGPQNFRQTLEQLVVRYTQEAKNFRKAQKDERDMVRLKSELMELLPQVQDEDVLKQVQELCDHEYLLTADVVKMLRIVKEYITNSRLTKPTPEQRRQAKIVELEAQWQALTTQHPDVRAAIARNFFSLSQVQKNYEDRRRNLVTAITMFKESVRKEAEVVVKKSQQTS